MSGEEHEQAHDRHVRTGNGSGDGEPQEEVPHEALDRASSVDHPRTRQPRGRRVAAASASSSIEEARKDAGVGADIFEDGNGVERRLVIALARFEDRRVDSEGVGAAAAALNPNARHRGYPFAGLHGSLALPFLSENVFALGFNAVDDYEL